MWELLFLCLSKPVALVSTVKKDLAATQKELDDLKTGTRLPVCVRRGGVCTVEGNGVREMGRGVRDAGKRCV